MKCDVCSAKHAVFLDNLIRKWLQNPRKILNEYIKEGMTVVDLGCGPGFFSLELARLVGDNGKVIAADLQQAMLDKVKKKISRELEKRIELHKCVGTKIGITKKADIVFVFYVAHEVPDQRVFLGEIKSILKPKGELLIVEPKFHVSKKEFKDTFKIALELGFKLIKKPRVILSRAVLLKT